MAPKAGYADWEITQLLAERARATMHYSHPSRNHGRDRPPDADLRRRQLRQARRRWAAIQWPCNEQHPKARPIMHVEEFVRGKGRFMLTEYVPTDESAGPRYPADPDHRAHPDPVQRRRPDPPHRQRRLAHRGPPRDPPARRRGPRHRRRRLGRGSPAARARPRCAALVTERVPPGVVYTTFHHPVTAGQRRHHRVLRLGDQLPRVQGHGGAGDADQRAERLAGGLHRAGRAFAPHRHHHATRRMSSTIETLRRMADDIAKIFEALGHGNAVLATADHIRGSGTRGCAR